MEFLLPARGQSLRNLSWRSIRELFFGTVLVLLIFLLLKHSYPQDVQRGGRAGYPTYQTHEHSKESLQNLIQLITNVFPGEYWETRDPAWAGLDEARLDQFVNNVGGMGCIIRFGYLVKIWGNPSRKRDWGSCRKTVTSLMLLFAIHEGKLSGVDALVDPVVQSLFGQELIEKDKTMTFRHLANMVSGYALPEAPGAAWAYNDYAISLYNKTLFDGVFGEIPNEVITAPNRLGQLEFEDGSIFSSRQGYGLYTSPRDFARIGWFVLNKGNWNGTQILPEHYFDDYIKIGVPGNLPNTVGGPPNDYLNVWFTGGGADQTPYGPGVYGFNWWFNGTVGTSGSLMWPDAPIDTYQANGHWNQETLTIFPEDRMVVAVIGDLGNWQPGDSMSGANQNLKLLRDAIVSDSPLPVRLVDFTVEPAGNTVVLRWTTAFELNLYGFFVERALDMADTPQEPHWQEIGFVAAQGGSTSGRAYDYIDPDAGAGLHRYRLRIVDAEGTVNYSNEVSIRMNRIINGFVLEQNYPNPFNPVTNVRFLLGERAEVTLSVYDALGRRVARIYSNQWLSQGEHNIPFDASGLESGIYFYRLEVNSIYQTRKMVVLH